ncbi:aspartic peptidase domain-containing protein [Clohesyomyces aquaticus]|uniref:Aspartic peptidase domain-containing protein n=1 Tax=Clohesyomyces aquaticus TaxID=1231657 RepID=A0A1Y1ZP68_9PLEO|nr:aspartic peptidase domain-containing protein [Clohesyomyces aquaticus]
MLLLLAVDATPAPGIKSALNLPLHTVQIPTSNEFNGFMHIVNVTIGSNNQTVPLEFDLGSAVIWVNPDCQQCEKQTKARCEQFPRYNVMTSKTSKLLDKSFNRTYGGYAAAGVYFTDDIKIGSVTVKQQQIGLAAETSNFSMGLWGSGQGTDLGYPTVVQSLSAQGQINSAAFSLDLRPVKSTGSLTFGGIDTKKYRCDLGRVPFQNFTQQYYIHINGVGQTPPGKQPISYPASIWNPENNTEGTRVFIDSGVPYNYLPQYVFAAIGKDYPRAKEQFNEHGVPKFVVPCEAPTTGTIDLTFGSKTVKIPYQDMVVNEYGTCYLGFALAPPGFYILGMPFLRGAYVVFDNENREVWIGESDDCGSDVVPIGKGKDAVPIVAGCGCQASNYNLPVYAAPSATASVP